MTQQDLGIVARGGVGGEGLRVRDVEVNVLRDDTNEMGGGAQITV